MNLDEDFADRRQIAVVTYVPRPLGLIVDEFCSRLSPSRRAQAHITLLPPRPLNSSLEIVSGEALEIVQRFDAFEVELGRPECFDVTNVLYIGLEKGQQCVRELHDALNTGNLQHSEEFEFRPHLTLSDPLPLNQVANFRSQVETFWNSVACPRRFWIDEVVFLCGVRGEWTRIWSENLRYPHHRKAVSGS